MDQLPIGYTVTVINNTTGAMRLTCSNNVTVYRSGYTTPYLQNGGDKTMASKSMAVLLKTDTDEWYITGSNLSD
jgi:hypothetical protein